MGALDIIKGISNVVGTGLGITSEATKGKRRRQALQDQKSLMNTQRQQQQMLNEHGLGISKELWDYTNYPNQIKAMREAGLSTGLMYGLSGGGGATTSGTGGGSAASGQAPAPAYMDVNQITQASKVKAEIDLMEAQAEKLKAEAKKTSGVDTEEATTRIADINEGIENKRAERRLNMLIGDFQEIENEIQSQTKEANIEKIYQELNQTTAEALNTLLEVELNKETLDAKIKTTLQEYENLTIEALVKKKGIELNEAQIESLKTMMQEAIRSNDIKQLEYILKDKLPNVANVAGGLIIEGATKIAEILKKWTK